MRWPALVRRRPRLSALAALLAVAAVVAAALGGSHDRRSATLHRWQSADLVGVPGEAPGTCASAYPPWQWQLDADEWIVCARRGGGHRCYRRRMHAVTTGFKAPPIRPSRFDADCRAALAVLRRASLLH